MRFLLFRSYYHISDICVCSAKLRKYLEWQCFSREKIVFVLKFLYEMMFLMVITAFYLRQLLSNS